MNNRDMITSSGNQVIKLARSLRTKKNRQERGLFLVEGIHIVGAAIEAGWEISSLIYSPDMLSSSFAISLIKEQQGNGVKCYKVLPGLFNNISDKDNPQGILAIVHQKELKLDELDVGIFNWGIAVISPQDPGNVGTILRTIDSIGADGLFLLNGGVDPFHPSCIRASMGAVFWKPVIQTSFHELISWSRLHNYFIIGSSAYAENDFRTLSSVKRPCILILGSEQKGMTEDEKNSCDLLVSIPMVGHCSSLNISVAAGIMMYAQLNDNQI